MQTGHLIIALRKDILAVTTSPQYNNGNGPNVGSGGHAVGDVVGTLECVYCGNEGKAGKDKESKNSPDSKAKSKDKQKQRSPEQEQMIEYIDKVMSIPSCVSNAASKVTLLTKWIKMAAPTKVATVEERSQAETEVNLTLQEEQDKKKRKGSNASEGEEEEGEEGISNYDCFDAFSGALNWESNVGVGASAGGGPYTAAPSSGHKRSSRPKTGPGGRKLPRANG